MSGRSRDYSEEERRSILDSLSALFDRAEAWHSATAMPVDARPGSLLAVADELSKPFQASFTVNQLLTNATDHLHALRTLFVTARAQHIYAPYTLIRSAIENATTVLFMLRDATPQSAAFEALRYEWANIAEQHRAALTVGIPRSEAEAAKQRKTEMLDRAVRQSGARPDRVKGAVKSFTQMMEEVSRVYGLGPIPHTMWQLCSAATHGKRWAVPMLAMMDAVDDGVSGTVIGKIVSDEASIRNALFAACQVLERALTVREAHSRPAGHTGRSFFRVAAN